MGGNAPSHYLPQIQTHSGVQLDDDAVGEILRTYCIEAQPSAVG